MLTIRLRPGLLGLLGAALLCSVGHELSAQDSPTVLRQQAFLALGDQWEVVRKAVDSARPRHATLAPCFAGDSAALGLVTSRNFLRQGESLEWELVPAGLPDALHVFEPELWVDGVLFGTGWHSAMPHAVALNADLVWVEVRLPREQDTLKWSVSIPLKSTCIPPAPDLPPWSFDAPDNPWWISAPYSGGAVNGMAVTLLGSDGVFDRPLIVVEGFDPDLTDAAPSYGFGTMNWDAIWDCSDLAYPNTAAMAVLLDSLGAEGFDLVYVDFADGTRSAAAQAALLARVLDLVNETVIGEGNSVVVGASMGGAIARLALRQRELAGISDCVSQFITLDTPHQGAYLPLALQEALAFFAQQDVQAASLLDALNSPAARELLLLTPDGALPEHLALQAELGELGWPRVPHCLAISNGHPLVSLNQGGAALIEGVINDWGVNWAQIQLWPLPGNPYHSASTPSASVVFDCSLPNLNGAWWSDPVLTATAHCAPSAPAWEDVPGSASPHIQALSQGLSDLGFELINSTDWTAFVPVASALDEGSDSELARRHEPVGSAPAPHCDLTGHVDHLLDFILEGADATAPMEGDASGFPHWGHLRPLRTFMGGGVLQAGDEWTVGTPLGNGGWGTDWPVFTVDLAPCASDLILENGSALIVGESSGQGTGILRVNNGNRIQLHDGGTLSIGTGSGLRIRAGGTLVLDGGSLVLSDGATLAVDPGGRIAVGSDTEIVLPAWSTWSQFGELACLTGTTLLVAGEANSSFSLSGTVEVAETAEWRLEGLESPLSVILSGAAECTGPGEVKWQGLDVHQGPESFLDLNASQRWNDVNVWSDGSATISSYARWRWHGGEGDRLAIYHSRPGNADPFWEDVQLSSTHVFTEFCAPRIWDCQFTHSSWEAWFAAGGVWKASAFSGNGQNTGLLIAHATGDVRIDGCTFSACQTGVRLEYAEAHLACSTWNHNGIGIGLSEGGKGWLTGVNGGHNHFIRNGIHANWDGGPWWECAGGHNQFGYFSEAGFTGELAGTSSPFGEALNAALNHWNSELDYLGFTNLNLELLTLPEDSGPTSCGPASPPTPIDDAPKSHCAQHGQEIHWHPQHPSAGTLRMRDATGRVLHEIRVGEPQKEIVWLCPDHASGLHLIEWLPTGTGARREAVRIWLQ